MGLASSQARLLSLTARMHQIEYSAQRVEAMKLQMANESRKVYEDYLDALDKTKLQIKTLTTNGAVTYSDIATYQDFLTAGFAIDFKGVVYDGSAVKYGSDGKYYAADAEVITVGAGQEDLYPGFNEGDTIAKLKSGEYAIVPDGITFEEKTLDWDALCLDAFGATSTDGMNVEEVITNLINTGLVTISTLRKDTGEFAQEGEQDFGDYETSVAINTSLQEVTDEVELRKAEAKYEADMKRIDMKDRRYDTQLAAIEQERNAIKQEMETLKTVAKDNVERTFKLFS